MKHVTYTINKAKGAAGYYIDVLVDNKRIYTKIAKNDKHLGEVLAGLVSQLESIGFTKIVA